jgi:hypothetical protein
LHYLYYLSTIFIIDALEYKIDDRVHKIHNHPDIIQNIFNIEYKDYNFLYAGLSGILCTLPILIPISIIFYFLKWKLYHI